MCCGSLEKICIYVYVHMYIHDYIWTDLNVPKLSMEEKAYKTQCQSREWKRCIFWESWMKKFYTKMKCSQTLTKAGKQNSGKVISSSQVGLKDEGISIVRGDWNPRKSWDYSKTLYLPNSTIYPVACSKRKITSFSLLSSKCLSNPFSLENLVSRHSTPSIHKTFWKGVETKEWGTSMATCVRFSTQNFTNSKG